MYVIFLQCTHFVEKTVIFSCTLLCESGDRVKCDQSSFSAYLHAVMLRHHCSEYARVHERLAESFAFRRPRYKLGVRYGDPGHDRVLRTKTWSGAKTTRSS